MSEITVPAMGESITEGTIYKWHVQEGDAVNQGDVLLELETDKVNLEISAEESGVVEKILRKDGETVQIGEVIGRLAAGGEAAAAASAALTKEEPKAEEKAAPAAPSVPAEPAKEGETYLAASPAARKLAREQGIDLEQVNRDPKGRIYQENVRNHAEAPAPRPAAAAPAAQTAAPSRNLPARKTCRTSAHVPPPGNDRQTSGGSTAHGRYADYLQRSRYDRDYGHPQTPQRCV